jgi:hypothetical protein
MATRASAPVSPSASNWPAQARCTAHPRLLGIDELTPPLTEVPRVREAVCVLVEDGLATRLGQLVGLSRAAVRFQARPRRPNLSSSPVGLGDEQARPASR